MFAWLRWQYAKYSFLFHNCRPEIAVPIEPSALSHNIRDRVPTVGPYDVLAGHWSGIKYAVGIPYGRLLSDIERYCRVQIQSVLDLACGTGIYTREFAQLGKLAVGLDSSEKMLEVAASHATKTDSPRYLHGDFRKFDLGQLFDAAICGGDSLNYLNEPTELASVMKCVAAHLTGGGVFLFDVLDELYFHSCDNMHRIMQVGDQPIEMHMFYDKETRRNDVRVVIGNEIERHLRVPIEVRDVSIAAKAAGLVVRDRFSAADYYYLDRMTSRQFYVLQKPT